MLLSQPVRPTTGEGEAISPRLEKPLATSLDIFKECGQIAGQIHQAASLVTADTIRFDGGSQWSTGHFFLATRKMNRNGSQGLA